MEKEEKANIENADYNTDGIDEETKKELENDEKMEG